MTTLLTGVNDVLRKVHIISGDAGALTTFTDSARQVFIDVALQSWNEMIDDLYSRTQQEKPQTWTSNTISLVTGTRTYALQTDVIELHWPFHNITNGQYIREHKPGYLNLVQSQNIPASYTGLPYYAALDPTASAPQIYTDRIPTASENGDAYTYFYQKDSGMTATTDVMPFNNAVYRSLVPAVTEVWQRHQHKDFDKDLFNISMGRAARFLGNQKQRTSWLPRRYMISEADPYHAQ